MSLLLIAEAVLVFTPNQAYRKITLPTIWLSFNVHFLMNFWDLTSSWFLFSFFLFSFMKSAWFARTHHLFIGACLWIASSRAALNQLNWILLFFRKVWLYSVFLLNRIPSLLVTSFYEHQTTRCLLSQKFGSLLAYLLILDKACSTNRQNHRVSSVKNWKRNFYKCSTFWKILDLYTVWYSSNELK